MSIVDYEQQQERRGSLWSRVGMVAMLASVVLLVAFRAAKFMQWRHPSPYSNSYGKAAPVIILLLWLTWGVSAVAAWVRVAEYSERLHAWE